MALSRRTGARFQASIWPGFVDAMTGLLLVLMFVLTIFMVVQFVLTERITGQENELNALGGEIAALAEALGLEQRKASGLRQELGELDATLRDAQSQIAQLTATRDRQALALEAAQGKITDFESQVAALLGQRDAALADLGASQGREAALLDEQAALNLALATARSEVDAQAEAARLAAARREALTALVEDLKSKNAQAGQDNTALSARLDETVNALDAQEAARLAEAAAAQALRERLKQADAELTAMTLALEEKRREAEDTLTLLAAARAAKADLDTEMARAQAQKLAAQDQADKQLSKAEERAALLALANRELAAQEQINARAQRQTELLNQQVAALRAQLGDLQALLDDAKDRDRAAKVQLQSLGTELNTALARVAAAERRKAVLEAAERQRLEQEAKALKAQTEDLEQYRSEFFGRLRAVLGNQDGVRIEGDRFVFSSEVLFAAGAAELSFEGQGEIAKVANILRSVAGNIPPEIDWIIRVDGHTDNVPLSGRGEFSDNWELSQARALSVVRFMVGFLDIPPDRLSANGFGQYHPIATGDTEAAHAQNRRIELKFTEK